MVRPREEQQVEELALVAEPLVIIEMRERQLATLAGMNAAEKTLKIKACKSVLTLQAESNSRTTKQKSSDAQRLHRQWSVNKRQARLLSKQLLQEPQLLV